MIRQAHTTLLVCALAGCADRVPLAEVPILGASDEQRALLEDELANFDRWAGAGRIELTSVEVTEDLDHHGVYTPSRRRIRLFVEVPLDRLRSVFRHELCHALSFREDLMARDPGPFEDLTDLVRADDDHFLHWIVEGESRGRAREELFAKVCEQAPLGTGLLAHPCGGDPEDLSAPAAYVNREVWTAEPDVSPDAVATLSESVSAPFKAREDVRELSILGAAADDRAQFVVGFADLTAELLYLDLRDGGPANQFFDLDEAPYGPVPELPVGTPDVPPSYPGIVSEVGSVASGDEALVLVDGYRSNVLERPLEPHLIAWRDDRWTVVGDACPGPAASVFGADGTLRVGWFGGDRLSWASLDPP